MGIDFGNNNIGSIHIGGISVANVYMGNSLVWSSSGKDPLVDWNYYLSDDKYILTGYRGDWANTVYVPIADGKTIINRYTSGETTIASNTPFHSNPNVKSVDLQNVPFVSNSMYNAFFNCGNLVSVSNINPNVTNMYQTFSYCRNLNPEQNIIIPNSVTNMYSTFGNCSKLNQNIQIGSNVKDMSYAFYNCSDLNRDIQIPNSVTNMNFAFYNCRNLQGTINISSNQVTDASYCFNNTSLPKNVYIPFKYSNGVNSATFNSFVDAGYLYANGVSIGRQGVTVKDSGYGNSGCVFYNTSILMADKTTKEAQEIKVGDLVQTYNEDTKEFESNKVLNVRKSRKDDIIKVKFEDDSFIELTSGHPFLTEKGWASYDNDKTRKENLYNGAELYQLEVGDKCMTQDGTYLEITNIEYEELGTVDVYDFTIENAHTFVGGGKVLHNTVTGSEGDVIYL